MVERRFSSAKGARQVQILLLFFVGFPTRLEALFREGGISEGLLFWVQSAILAVGPH